MERLQERDRKILRELACRQREIAADGRNRERRERILAMHSLEPVRPPVWIDEIPWHEMDIDGELELHCEGAAAREIECQIRRTLFRWKYFPVDMVVEDALYVTKAYEDSGIGVRIRETVLQTDTANPIVSHQYEDQLDSEEKLAKLQIPVIRARPDLDAARLEWMREIFDGVIPVRLRGHGIYHAPWDDIAMLRGAEACLIDMLERPDFTHAMIGRFTDIAVARYEQMETQGLLEINLPALHCTPPYTADLPAPDHGGGPARLRDIWFRGMAQLLSSVSPALHNEYDIVYMRRLSDRCGLAYYGCCEPLDRMIPYLKKMPNLRKIGVSPWADKRSSAEQIGGDYVYACKPNPAAVATRLDAEAVRAEICEVIELCIEHGCPYEFVLKDISTVGHRPGNLIEWARVVMETIDGYYG